MLPSLKYNLGKLIYNYKFWMFLIVLAVFIGLSIYGYKQYVVPKVNPNYVANKEFVNEGDNDEVELMFFYTTWCPHCKSAMPIWNKFKEDNQNTVINGRKIVFVEIDCDTQESIAKEYGIEGYPTIKLIKDGQVIEYDAKPDYDTLQEFIQTTL